MNKIKIILIITSVVLILYFIIGIFLPSKIHFEASVDIVKLAFD